MNSSNKFTDDVKKFYHDVDRLCKLIEVAIDKRQTNNVERYLKYFFRTMIRYYEKASVSDNDNWFNNILIKQSPDETPINRYLDQLEQRRVTLGNEDFFVNKIKWIVFKIVENDDFELFYFIFNLINDSISYLFEQENLINRAEGVISVFKSISNYIVTRKQISSRYTEKWFEDYTYRWFINLYPKSNLKTITILEREVMVILKDYINNNKVELFEQFLLSLSSSILVPLSTMEEALVNL